MNIYIGFLAVIFVLAAVSPEFIRRPPVILGLCVLFALSVYSTQLIG